VREAKNQMTTRLQKLKKLHRLRRMQRTESKCCSYDEEHARGRSEERACEYVCGVRKTPKRKRKSRRGKMRKMGEAALALCSARWMVSAQAQARMSVPVRCARAVGDGETKRSSTAGARGGTPGRNGVDAAGDDAMQCDVRHAVCAVHTLAVLFPAVRPPLPASAHSFSAH
jgi:hypothetical protein